MIGDVEKAEAGYRWCIDTCRALTSPDDDTRALLGWSCERFGVFLDSVYRSSEACPYLQQALAISRTVDPSNKSRAAQLLSALSSAHLHSGNAKEAESSAREALDLAVTARDEFTYVYLANLATILEGPKRTSLDRSEAKILRAKVDTLSSLAL